MNQSIPSGQYQLIIVVDAQDLHGLNQCSFIERYGIQPQDISLMDGETPYCELNLDSADLQEVALSIASQNINADIQVLPSLDKAFYGLGITFNAYVRRGDDTGEVHINSKDNDNTAHELEILLKELNGKGITQADEIIKGKIAEFHPHGWV